MRSIPHLGEPIERLLELRVGIRTLELKKIKVAFFIIEMKAIYTVVVPTERHLRVGPATVKTELLF